MRNITTNISIMLKHWITGNDSVVKSISTKPLWITTRDAIIVTALTLVTTLIVMAIYWWYYELPTDYIGTATQTIVASMASQYLYEYSGANNMIAESSLRYAHGSTLEKYTSRREAIAYKCLYRLKLSGYDNPTLQKRFDQLISIITSPDMTGAMSDYAQGKLSQVMLIDKYPESKSLLELPLTTLQILESLTDRINEPLIYDILVNGFEQYHVESSLLTDLSEDEINTGEMRGQKIMGERKLN